MGPRDGFIPCSQSLLMVARLVMLDKRHSEELTDILCCSVLVPALLCHRPLPALRSLGRRQCGICYWFLTSRGASFLTQPPGTIPGSYVPMKYGSVGAGWRALSMGSLQENSPVAFRHHPEPISSAPAASASSGVLNVAVEWGVSPRRGTYLETCHLSCHC